MATKSKKPSPALEAGQLWKTDKDYIYIWHIGKRLIDYKMTKNRENKAVRTLTTYIETLKAYLKDNGAVLVK